MELDEDEKETLDRKLRVLADHLAERPVVVITYFEPDEKKAGGSYEEAGGPVRKIDDFERTIIFENGRSISIDDIYELESDLPYLQF